MSYISICFAVYQNQGSLVPLYERMVHELKTHFPHHSYELLFVNDGSKDNSLKELLSLREKDPHVKVISFSRNFGQMAAILAGWEKATGDCVINMAADLQDPPEQCTLMIREWEKGNDIVISYRISHATSTSRRLTSKLFYKMMLPDAPPGGFDFVLLDRTPMNAINSLKERHRFYQYDILWAGFTVKYIPYHKEERRAGKSQYNFIKRFANFYSGFLSVSFLPLRLMAASGVVVAFGGFVYALTIIWAYFVNATPFEGWSPIMILILVLGGLIMLMLGMLGEYIWRILDEVRGRPNYIIKDIFECIVSNPSIDWDSIGVHSSVSRIVNWNLSMSRILQYKMINGVKCFNPDVAESYDDYPDEGFDVTDQLEAKSFWVRSRTRLIKRIVDRYVTPLAETKFLDIGCGTGAVIQGIMENKYLTITGSEIYLGGLIYAKKKLPEVEFVQFDVTQGRLPESFGMIGAFDVIEHIDDDVAAISNVYAMLSDGGYFVITVPQYMFLWSRLDEIVKHKRRYSRRELLSKLRRQGFEISFCSSFVFALFPLMLVSRFFDRGKKGNRTADVEFKNRVEFPNIVNRIFDLTMRIDEALINRAISLPYGGSLLVVAKKSVPGH